MQLQFLAPVDFFFFLAVERLQFLTRAELLFFMIYSFLAVRFVMSTFFFLRREHSTIVEGQRFRTVHIMEASFLS